MTQKAELGLLLRMSIFVDDLTNQPIEERDGELVMFSLDRVPNAIDLSAEYADEFCSLPNICVPAARKADADASAKARWPRRS